MTTPNESNSPFENSEQPKLNPNSMWLVVVELRPDVIRISPMVDGFFIPGEEPMWPLSHVETWIREITVEGQADTKTSKDSCQNHIVDANKMSPKPPEGFASWLDYALHALPAWSGRIMEEKIIRYRDLAKAELAALRRQNAHQEYLMKGQDGYIARTNQLVNELRAVEEVCAYLHNV